MSCPCCPPPASEYRRFFRRKVARADTRRYERRGLSKTARALAASVDGETVLDVGGGVGTLAIELLERGAARATVVELSDGYDEAAAELLAERGLADRVERRSGDFVTQAGLVEPHDAVVLHRVVCCYPDADALVSAAASHARRSLALTLPRQNPLTRLGFRTINGFLRLRGCGFRAYVHPFAVVAAAARHAGLELTSRDAQGLIWENAVFERLADGGAGTPPGMEPRHEPEELADDPGARPTEDEGEVETPEHNDAQHGAPDDHHGADPDEEDQSGL